MTMKMTCRAQHSQQRETKNGAVTKSYADGILIIYVCQTLYIKMYESVDHGWIMRGSLLNNGRILRGSWVDYAWIMGGSLVDHWWIIGGS